MHEKLIVGRSKLAEPLHISESIADELRYIVAISPKKLASLAAALERTTTIVTRRELLKIFRESLGPSSMNSRVVSNLASLNLLRDDPDKDPDVILESLISGCEASGNEDLAAEISKRKAEIVKLLNSETLYMSIKASQLFSLDSKHLHELKIVCDARPLFNPSREDFRAAIVYSTLHITASDSSENEEQFSIALRAHELDEIIQECERAKQKMLSLQNDLSKLKDKTIVQYGDTEL